MTALAPLLLALGASFLAPIAPNEQGVDAPDDKALRSLWARLDVDQRVEAIEWFRLEARYIDTFQLRLVRHVLGTQSIDPGLWPDAGPAPIYDPALHAPRQPIPRRRLSPTDKRLKRARKALLPPIPAGTPPSAWRYDWAGSGLVRTADDRSPEHVFELAVTGMPPDADLALALTLRSLDAAQERGVLTAFAHCYTDRAGNAYGGITLFDAWNSGQEIEMPDVDVLGIVHDVLDEWRRWVAPVPGSKHDALYKRVGELFLPARRYRGLREAIAACYLSADTPLPGGYGGAELRFHALWERSNSSPDTLKDGLPDGSGWKQFLDDLTKSVGEDEELFAAAERRRATLRADAAVIRRALARVLAGIDSRDG